MMGDDYRPITECCASIKALRAARTLQQSERQLKVADSGGNVVELKRRRGESRVFLGLVGFRGEREGGDSFISTRA